LSYVGPELLTAAHGLEAFDCGKPVLNDWLGKYALSNQLRGFTRVLVIHQARQVVGYYGLAPTAVPPMTLNRALRTGRPPDPVPCILLGQLATDLKHRGQGIGTRLVRDALWRCLSAADTIGGRAVIVRAVDEEAVAFWKSWDFVPARSEGSTLFRGIDDIRLWFTPSTDTTHTPSG
jgi:GNAT superfamily N-acetyltransferase